MISFRRGNGSPLRLGRALDAGGEGKIYTIVGELRLVAKIYHQPTPEKIAKLNIMLANPPRDPMRRQGHISIAWPTEAVFDMRGRCMGFLMPYIDTTKSFPLLKLYNPQDRRQTLPEFTWRYLLRTAKNIASVLQALHDSGYVVGDLNESNILVTSTALVTLVDCDSIQVYGNGMVYPCPVGKSEFTPPELQGRNFSQINRVASHDNFGLAVLIFLLLMEGRHPFTGIWQGSSTPPTLEQNIRLRSFPYIGVPMLTPPKNALSFDILPRSLQRLMIRSFTWRRWQFFRDRPRAGTWFKALGKLEKQLTVCSSNRQHVYSQHLRHCPWCERMGLGIPDPFPPSRNAIPLPPTRTTSHPSPRINNVRRLVNTPFGCIIPLILFGIEGILWYMHQNLFNEWFSQASNILKGVILLSVLVLPFLISSILSEFLRWLRSTRRANYSNRPIRRR